MKPKYSICILFLIIHQIVCFAAFAQQESHQQQSLRFIKSSIPVVPGSKGDVDGNGIIEIFDLIRARDISIGRLSNPDYSQIFAGDIDSDGSVGNDDVERIRDILLLKAVPPPTIISINPASGREGEQITIDGAGFDPIPSNNLVTFGGVQATVITATTTRLTVIVPVGATGGNVIVTVAGQSSNAVNFNLLTESGPVISSISPDMGVIRQEVVIEGLEFGAVQGNSTVLFGNVVAEVEDIIFWSDTKIISKVPEGSSTGEVKVTVAGKVSNGILFTIVIIEVTEFQPEDIVEDPESGASYVRNTIILDFEDNISEQDISNFLSTNNLTQIGQISRPKIIQARIGDSKSPFELANLLESSPLLESASPDLISDFNDVVSESFTSQLLSSFNGAQATFTGLVGVNNYHHFAMRTFAAHRLVDAILDRQDRAPEDVRVAIIDTGLGNGTIPEPIEFEFRIRAPTRAFSRLFAFPPVFAGIQSDITTIPDEANHGTGVAGMAGAEGIVTLGISKHANIRPIDVSVSDSGKTATSAIASGIEYAALDPKVEVINLSWGTGKKKLSQIQNIENRDRSAKVIKPMIEFAVSKGKIITIAAGNDSFDTSLSSPQVFAPDRYSGEEERNSDAPTILNVAATDLGSVFYLDDATSFSNFGNKISVSAPGDFSNTILKNDFTSHSARGTSFAAPLVAGLAAEMIITNPNLSAQQIIRIIEKTADDISPLGFDTQFGSGRVNAWKAILSAVNGGLATEAPNAKWYGFEIRASEQVSDIKIENVLEASFKNAQVYINFKKLSDFLNSQVPKKDITLFKKVPPQGIPGSEFIPIPEINGTILTDFLTTFSITSDELSEADGEPVRLALRQPGQTIDDVPFYELPLNLTKLKSGSVPGVTFDDFVFNINIPRILKTESIKDVNPRSITTQINGVNRTIPIGVTGDKVVLTISFPGYNPSVSNTDIEFFPPQNAALVEPENIKAPPTQLPEATTVIETTVHDRAGTGPVKIFFSDEGGDLITTFATLDPFIVAKAVGFNLAGTNPGDHVQISINVPHFTATTSNTKIKFPGNNPEVAPDQVTDGTPPDVTHVLHTTIPENLEEGMVKILITVDNGQQVEFDGGEIVFFDRTNYAGTLTLDEFTTPYYNGLPPAGQRAMPVRFTLNKTIENEYFFTASIENWPFAFGPTLTAVLDEGLLHFYESWTVEGITSDVSISAYPDNDALNGTWSITLKSGSSIMMYWHANFDAQVETEVGDFNGAFWGRPIRRNEGEGDQELLESLENSILPAEFFMHYPLAFVQVDQLMALTWVFQQSAAAPSGASDGMQKSVAGQNNNNLASIPDFPFVSNNYVVLNYYVGSLDGNRFTFDFDDTGRLAPYYYVDLDPFHNTVTTYDLTKNGDNLTGTITLMREDIDQEETKTATIVFDYSGRLQKEDENDISIIGIVPPPEIGFPNIAGDVVTLTKVTVGYNYVGGTEGTVILRAFKNNNTSDILAESELPIQFIINKGGKANFDNFNIPGVGSDVTTISIFAGLRSAGSTTFIVESGVISYSR